MVKMDKFQAAFELLYLLSTADGEVTMSEVNVIRSFLESNYGSVSFNPSGVIDEIATLNSDGMLEEFGTAAMVFKNSSGVSDRTVLLRFAVELICADGNVSDTENSLFQTLANLWNIDVGQFLKGLN
jgi:uncharacterized tellurite resistance protein B-like protein